MRDRRSLIDCGDEELEMTRQPQIIVAEVRDNIAAPMADAVVVGGVLVTVVRLEVVPPHAAVGDPTDNLG